MQVIGRYVVTRTGLRASNCIISTLFMSGD